MSIIFGDLTRFSHVLYCIESIMDNLGHFASVNTNTVQVFCTEAEKIALLVTVLVLLRYFLDLLCRSEL